jgi:hypothetical protein
LDSRGIELSEVVAFGGRLSAREDGFDLTYFASCSVPGRRPVAFKIDSSMFQAYIAALADNWRTYVTLRSSMPAVPFCVEGKLGMQIESEGVRFYVVHLRTVEDLETVSNMLRDARARGAQLHKEVLARLGRIAMPLEEKRLCFARFKDGAELGVSTNHAVVCERNQALALVRSKSRIGLTSCRYHVARWFGKEAAHEFMEDLRRNGLDVTCEQADFIITWNDRE